MSNRVLGRVGAHELTAEEIDRVYGADSCKIPTTHIPVTSTFPATTDVINDC